jgi:hypothetical protein
MMVAVLTVGTMVETVAIVRKGKESLFMTAVMAGASACVTTTRGVTIGARASCSSSTGGKDASLTASAGRGEGSEGGEGEGSSLADTHIFWRRMVRLDTENDALPPTSNLALRVRMWFLPSPVKSGREDHFLQPPWPGERRLLG